MYRGPNIASVEFEAHIDPDADILEGLARADERALAQLMDRHLDAIKSLAWHMLGDEMSAEDVAQEVFLKAWKHGQTWQSGRAKFSTWLYRVAKNACLDRLRKKREIYSDEVPEIADTQDFAPDAMIKAETHLQQKVKIERAMANLPKRQRLAITLCHYQNLSQKQAAEVMEIGVRAYESLLARARRGLKSALIDNKAELLGRDENEQEERR